MGRVFRARDTRLKREVAIKALPDEFALDADRVARLQIEAEALAGVFKQEADWSRLPQNTPPAIRHLLRRCLRKDQRQRLKDIGDARIEIEEARSEPESTLAGNRQRVLLPVWAWVLVTALAAASGASIAPLVRREAVAKELRVGSNSQQYAVSPGGSRFLINTTSEEAVAPPIAVIVNWHPSAAK